MEPASPKEIWNVEIHGRAIVEAKIRNVRDEERNAGTFSQDARIEKCGVYL